MNLKTLSSKRMLVYGRDTYGNFFKHALQQYGVNYDPHIKCPYTDVQLIAIYHKSDKKEAANLLGYFRNGNYKTKDYNASSQMTKASARNQATASTSPNSPIPTPVPPPRSRRRSARSFPPSKQPPPHGSTPTVPTPRMARKAPPSTSKHKN